MTVSQTGFSTFEAQNIRLALDQIYVLNLTLQVGTVNQRITVEAAPAQVETTSMELGATLKSNTVVDLPLNGRNWVQLQATLPSDTRIPATRVSLSTAARTVRTSSRHL